MLLNDGSLTRIGNINQNSSAIDLNFISSNLGFSCEWSTYNDALGSDHLPIITKIKWTNTQDTSSKNNHNLDPSDRRRKFKNANWESYTTRVKKLVTTKETHNY
jgi:hypothetical protein